MQYKCTTHKPQAMTKQPRLHEFHSFAVRAANTLVVLRSSTFTCCSFVAVHSSHICVNIHASGIAVTKSRIAHGAIPCLCLDVTAGAQTASSQSFSTLRQSVVHDARGAFALQPSLDLPPIFVIISTVAKSTADKIEKYLKIRAWPQAVQLQPFNTKAPTPTRSHTPTLPRQHTRAQTHMCTRTRAHAQ